MSAPLNLGQIADSVDLSIQKYFKKDSEVELQLKKYFNFRTTEDLYEKDSGLTGLAEATFTAENAQVTEDAPIETFDKTYTQEQMDASATYTYMAWKFGIKKRRLQNISREITRALNRKKERLAAERLTNGFLTSYSHTQPLGATRTITTTGGDSLEAFHILHTREDGGTGNNNVVYDGTTYSLPFDYAGYKAAIRTMSLFTDGRGNPYPAMPNKLVCKKGSSVSFKAKEILGAIRNGKIPESFDNDANGAPAFEVLELDYLTNDAYWFMCDNTRASTDEEGFQWVESEANNIDPVYIVPKTREMQFFGHTLATLGHNDVTRSWVASAGDSVTT
jgi:hypothetical protein